MKLIKIQSSKDPLIAQVPELYESAFSKRRELTLNVSCG